MRETELAIAMSAREWPDAIRRFLADHGGARVRVAAMGPEDLLAESYDVLLVDDICSFLTPRLVDRLVSRGRVVVGVYDPDEFPDGKQRLLELGVAEVVAAGADPDQFLAAIARVTVRDRVEEAAVVDVPVAPVVAGPRPLVLAIGGPPGGVGSTEVAVSAASRLALRGPTVLVDADDHAPAIAQRLGLALHPNVRTAIDILEHRSGPIVRALHRVGGHPLVVLPGPASVGDWTEVRARQMLDLIAELASVHDHVVVNVGSKLDDGFSDSRRRYGVSRAISGTADRLVAVGIGTPVGVTRLLEWVAVARSLRDGGPIDVLVNRAPSDAFRRGEVLEEITRTYRPASFSFLPDDPRLAKSAWDGTIGRGRFRKSVDRWVDQFVAGAA